MKIRVLSVTELDAAKAALGYDDQQPWLGDRLFAELEHAIKRIRRNPFLFPRLEYCDGGLDVRRCRLHRFPYIVVFLCLAEEIVVA